MSTSMRVVVKTHQAAFLDGYSVVGQGFTSLCRVNKFSNAAEEYRVSMKTCD